MSMDLEQEPTEKIVEDATCTFCGCLCDDIALSVDGNRIAGAANACSLGESWFASQGGDQGTACLIEGKPSSLSDGIERAARILNEARYPLVFGLAETTSAGQRATVSLADWIGGCVDPAPGVEHGSTTLAMQEVGQVTCTLGEVRNRGDLIIFWCCDPAESRPRHLSRYSQEPAGQFVARGRQDRFCIVVDVRKTATAEIADQFIALEPGKEFEALWFLRALAKGVDLEASPTESETGVPLSTWRALMERMKRANYGVIFFGSSQSTPFDAHQCSHAIFALVRDMNAHARFVSVSLGGPGNAAGADNVLTWQTGYPFAVNLARGYPRFGPGEYSASEVLSRAECDAALIVAGDPLAHLEPAAVAHLNRIPSIVLHSRDTAAARSATVAFRTATYGINTPGTVYRADGVPIPLRPALPSPLPADTEILKRIETRVRKLKTSINP
jgi:formylmethanofuran dehydrogenase subunit B